MNVSALADARDGDREGGPFRACAHMMPFFGGSQSPRNPTATTTSLLLRTMHSLDDCRRHPILPQVEAARRQSADGGGTVEVHEVRPPHPLHRRAAPDLGLPPPRGILWNVHPPGPLPELEDDGSSDPRCESFRVFGRSVSMSASPAA